jgi:hypothetical protein
MVILSACLAGSVHAADLFRKPEGVKTRWTSFENPSGAPGQGGQANRGGKGHAFDSLKAGETKTLLDVQGCGTIERMWFTHTGRQQPEMLRALRLEMFWDGADMPAVSVPFGDFFGAILGRATPFENELFSNPEGRSFNCLIPMPFRTAAKVTLTNDSSVDLDKLFYDINYAFVPAHDDQALYFHATWRRERWTELMRDFEILPKLNGTGRFLGAHVGLIEHPDNVGWWGEGEIKIFLDGDTECPTLVGTGTEDYIGTGWGQGVFAHRYQGCLVADSETKQHTFYRYHIPDPVYFDTAIRVTLQQMGGASKAQVLAMLEKGVEIVPVSADYAGNFDPLLEHDPPLDLERHAAPDTAWVNYFRRDDVAAVALFYLDMPGNSLERIADGQARTEGLTEQPSSR